MAASRRGFSANLAMLFQDLLVACELDFRGTSCHSNLKCFGLTQEVPFLDRLKRARAAGFTAVEISTPELFSHPPEHVATQHGGVVKAMSVL